MRRKEGRAREKISEREWLYKPGLEARVFRLPVLTTELLRTPRFQHTSLASKDIWKVFEAGKLIFNESILNCHAEQGHCDKSKWRVIVL